MPRFKNVDGVVIQLTPEEEIVRDNEVAEAEIEKAEFLEREVHINALEAKLADDSITFEEMKELMRLRG